MYCLYLLVLWKATDELSANQLRVMRLFLLSYVTRTLRLLTLYEELQNTLNEIAH